MLFPYLISGFENVQFSSFFEEQVLKFTSFEKILLKNVHLQKIVKKNFQFSENFTGIQLVLLIWVWTLQIWKKGFLEYFLTIRPNRIKSTISPKKLKNESFSHINPVPLSYKQEIHFSTCVTKNLSLSISEIEKRKKKTLLKRGSFDVHWTKKLIFMVTKKIFAFFANNLADYKFKNNYHTRFSYSIDY